MLRDLFYPLQRLSNLFLTHDLKILQTALIRQDHRRAYCSSTPVQAVIVTIQLITLGSHKMDLARGLVSVVDVNSTNISYVRIEDK